MHLGLFKGGEAGIQVNSRVTSIEVKKDGCDQDAADIFSSDREGDRPPPRPPQRRRQLQPCRPRHVQARPWRPPRQLLQRHRGRHQQLRWLEISLSLSLSLSLCYVISLSEVISYFIIYYYDEKHM